MTPVYTASAKVYFVPIGGKANGNEGETAITREELETYVEVLTSPAVLDPLREDFGIPAGTPIHLAAEVSTTTNVMIITAEASTAQRAADIANAAGPELAAVAPDFSPLLAAAGQRVQSRPIAPAAVPGRPTSPKPASNIGLGLLIGLGLGTALALLRHSSDTRIRGEADVRGMSDRPVLARIPVARGRSATMWVEDDRHGPQAEAIRRLRTNLMFVDITTGSHSFVITSPMPQDGKTTTAVNLARALADAGSSVLLVDGDLRRPMVASVLGLEGSVGLTTILLGRASPDEVIHRWGDSRLHILPAGETPPNPTELLGSAPMHDLFALLAKEFDYLVVDSPPVVPVVDAVLLNKLAGGLLMVVAVDRTRKRDLSTALRSLAAVEQEPVGFALNMDSGSPTRSYKYMYYGTAKQNKRARRAARRAARQRASTSR